MSTVTVRICDACAAHEKPGDEGGRWYEMHVSRWFNVRNGNLDVRYHACSSPCARALCLRLEQDVAADETEKTRQRAELERQKEAERIAGAALAEVLGVQPAEGSAER